MSTGSLPLVPLCGFTESNCPHYKVQYFSRETLPGCKSCRAKPVWYPEGPAPVLLQLCGLTPQLPTTEFPQIPGQGEFTQQAARPPQPAQTYRSPRTTTPTCAGWALHVEGPLPHLHCHSGASPPCPVKRPLLPLSEPWASRSFIPIPQHQHREDPGLGDVPGPPPSEPLGFRLLAHSHQGTEPVGPGLQGCPRIASPTSGGCTLLPGRRKSGPP